MTIDENGLPDFTDGEWREFSEKLMSRGEKEPALKQLKKLHQGKITQPHKALRYYFRELMYRARIYGKPPIVELTTDKNLFRAAAYSAVRYNQPIEPTALVSMLRVWGCSHKGGGRKIPGMGTVRLPQPVSNFNLKDAQRIWGKYNVNGVAYDYSCGWGTRMLGALSKGMRYLGVDTNPALVERLRECADDYAEVNDIDASAAVDIRCQSSEVLVPEWIGKVGVAFSSPPYFDIETYEGENTSTAVHPDYQDWLEGYMGSTLENAAQYLVPNGHLLVNVNDKIYDDIKELVFRRIPELEFMGEDEYDGGRMGRQHSRKDTLKLKKEGIMVFKKRVMALGQQEDKAGK